MWSCWYNFFSPLHTQWLTTFFFLSLFDSMMMAALWFKKKFLSTYPATHFFRFCLFFFGFLSSIQRYIHGPYVYVDNFFFDNENLMLHSTAMIPKNRKLHSITLLILWQIVSFVVRCCCCRCCKPHAHTSKFWIK